jgi:acetyl-CoA C-acetyltransferase
MATLYGFARAELDAYAAESQRRAAEARDTGRFARSLLPVRDLLGATLLDHDEGIRAGTTAVDLAKLKPVFGGLGAHGFDAFALERYPHIESIVHEHTSGNSSAIVDGACAVLIGNREFGAAVGLRPRARIVGFTSIASDPILSLGGPMPATERLLQRLGMAIGDIDLFEVNEAFSIVPLVYIRHFDIPPERVNVNGGSIALGHPLGATGAMLLGTVLDELERRDGATALVTLCAGGGQGTATVIERV